MAEKKYYWLKLKEDFFTQPKIKKLRRMAGGDTYTIIFLKMQLLSIRNGGVLVFEQIEKDFIEELALKIDEDVENVRFTLFFLQNQDMVEESIDGRKFAIPSAMESIGTESSSAERVRRFREKEKTLQCNGSELQCNTDVTETRYIVQKCNTEIDIDIDKDINLSYQRRRGEETDDSAIVDNVDNFAARLAKDYNLVPNVAYVESIVSTLDGIDQDRCELLEYACKESTVDRERNNWRYIDGIMQNLEKYGIKNMDDLMRHEWERRGSK